MANDKLTTALQTDKAASNASTRGLGPDKAQNSPTSELAATLAFQSGDEGTMQRALGSRYTPKVGRADKHASNIVNSSSGEIL